MDSKVSLLQTIDPDDFTQDEVKYAYYLYHLATVANAVIMEGKDRGFIDLVVWRQAKDNKPYNARVLENHISLAFFYVTDRPWNPYYGDMALKARIEAILELLCKRQSEDGRFSEYAPERYTLAPTSFGVRVLGETLRMLCESEAAGGPVIHRAVWHRAIEMIQKAIGVCLDHPDLLKTARLYSNQYVGFWGGVMAFLSAYPDADLEQRLVNRIRGFHTELTSPVGYYYERGGCDWAYTMRTHRNSIRQLWHYIRDKEMAKLIAQVDAPWIDWLNHNAVLEPDGEYFTLNQAIETRRHQPGFEYWDTPAAEVIPLAVAFHRTQSEASLDYARSQEELRAWWPEVGDLTEYLPSTFLDHTTLEDWRPTATERKRTREKLPYLTCDHSTHVRMDDRFDLNHTFIRRPTYYAIFNTGEIIYQSQRYGLGLVWHPDMGCVLQTQSRESGPWGTATSGHTVYEATSFHPTVEVDGKVLQPVSGKQDLPTGDVVFEYALGTVGQKSIRFSERHIEVIVEHAGAFNEHLPLLMRAGDILNTTGRQVLLRRLGGEMVIMCESDVTIQMLSTEIAHGPFELRRVVIAAHDRLQYRIAFD